MLTVILAGGKGTRILEETQSKPKAKVQIGGIPIIEHIMDSFRRQGFHDFLILAGHKSRILFSWFREMHDALSCEQDDVCMTVILPDMRVRVLETGEETGTAARLRLAMPYIDGERFLLTYCDGLCSVDFHKLLRFHEEHRGLITLTAVRPLPRFGVLLLDDDGRVLSMREKHSEDLPLINGGFMVVERDIFQRLNEDAVHLERDVLESLAAEGKLCAYCHDGFWQCMDTLPEKQYLCALWESGAPPWIAATASEL